MFAGKIFLTRWQSSRRGFGQLLPPCKPEGQTEGGCPESKVCAGLQGGNKLEKSWSKATNENLIAHFLCFRRLDYTSQECFLEEAKS